MNEIGNPAPYNGTSAIGANGLACRILALTRADYEAQEHGSNPARRLVSGL
jgi:hypothetical protein